MSPGVPRWKLPDGRKVLGRRYPCSGFGACPLVQIDHGKVVPCTQGGCPKSPRPEGAK